MREILFRGKPIDEETIIGNDFYYGDLCHYANGEVTIRQPETGYEIAVLPETVGQFMGITDKNGVKVFEGDIINETGKVNNGSSGTITVVNKRIAVTNQNTYGMVLYLSNYRSEMHHCTIEVIGSIHDTTELPNNQQSVR